MRIIFEVGHPAHVHLFKHIMQNLEKNGHNIKICVRERENIVGSLLDTYGFRYSKLEKNVPGIYNKAISMLKNDYKLIKISNEFNPDLFVSITSPYSAQVSKLKRKPFIAFADTEPARLILSLTMPFTDTAITPIAFRKKLGKKQIRIKGYKELAYLHPNWFKPDSNILDMLNISKGEKFVILRFSAFDASHDIGIKGFSSEEKRRLARTLADYARVFISSESNLPADLEEYALKIPPHKMHDALFYASLLVGDAGTMTTEAAVLGTPAIFRHPRSQEMGNFVELENDYGLIFNILEPNRVIEKSLELIQQPRIKRDWQNKREKLLKDKIDVTGFMTWFIETYPNSFKIMKETPEYHERFK